MNLNLIERILHHIKSPNVACQTHIDRLTLTAVKPPAVFDELNMHTALVFILSGEQEVWLGEHRHIVQAGEVYFVPFRLPIKAHFKPNTRPKFVNASLMLDEIWLNNIIPKVQITSTAPINTGVGIQRINPPTQNCLIRLLELIDAPNPALANLYQEELIVHLLSTPLAASLLAFANQDSHLRQIKTASEYLHAHFADKISIAKLAALAKMSESSFYHYFKQITGLTPLGYQKAVRLNHAKKLLLKEKSSVSQIAYQVGYESVSQFSREYKRQFGVSPSLQK